MYNSEFKLRGKIKMILLTHCVSVSVWILVLHCYEFSFSVFIRQISLHTLAQRVVNC